MRATALLLAGALLMCSAPASAQMVTTSTDAAGNTVTTTTTDLSEPLTSGVAGATYQTDHTETSVTTDGGGHEIDRHEVHVHENLDKQGGRVISRTTREITEHRDYVTGVWTTTSHTVVVNNNTHQTTTIDYTSRSDLVNTGDGAHWEQVDGHQTVVVEQPGQPAKKIERSYDGLYGRWEASHTISMLVPTVPQAGGSADSEHVYLPGIAGPSSQIVATVEDPTQDGPVDEVTVQVVDSQGHRHWYDAYTDPDGHIDFQLPAGAAAVALFTHFTRDREPDDAAAHLTVDPHATVSDADPVTNAPSSGPAIDRAPSAYERGGASRNLLELQTRDVDPLRARIVMDGSTVHVETVAASNLETIGQFDGDTALGRHTFAVKSGSVRSNAFPADIVTLQADPLGVSGTGTVQTVTVHCLGLPQSDIGTMYFQVGGAAVLADGETTSAVAVHDGVAEVRIRGVHAGPAIVRFHLHATINGFWT